MESFLIGCESVSGVLCHIDCVIKMGLLPFALVSQNPRAIRSGYTPSFSKGQKKQRQPNQPGNVEVRGMQAAP